MALNGCSLGAFLSNIGYWHTCDHVHCIFVPSLLLYCKAISMEWMNANVEFVLTPVTGYTVCERVCVCRDNERSTVTAGLYSNNNAKTKNPIQTRMQEDYYTNCLILNYYMLPVESCQDKWRATAWSREKANCPALNWPYIHFSQ